MENPEVKKTWVQTLPIWIRSARIIKNNPVFEPAAGIASRIFRFFQMKYPLINGIRKPWE